jgi:hypothetical protein
MTKRSESRAQDTAMANELKAHHALMINDLDRLSAELASTASSGKDAAPAIKALHAWIDAVLVPHATEEEETTYRAAAGLPEGKLLIESMLAEHVLIRQIATRVSQVKNPMEAGAYGRALFAIFDSHQRKENDIVLPLLVDSDRVSLAGLFAASHKHDHGHHGGHSH